MANPEHLAILKRGVEEWNEWRKEWDSWREEHGDVLLELRPEADAANVHLAGLYAADLREADLRAGRTSAGGTSAM